MARYRGPVCKLCRREGMQLFLKGARCETEKCAANKRATPPGQRAQSHARRRVSDYGLQLREKQKLKRMYGVLERQFRNYFQEAERRPGITGETLLQLLERRLDNVVWRVGWAVSRAQARLLIDQAHFVLNGKPVKTPSLLVGVNDVVAISESARKLSPFLAALERAGGRRMPTWLQTEADPGSARVIAIPNRGDIDTQVQEQLIVEFYSR
jgi:small subunit ribosomal protein S4